MVQRRDFVVGFHEVDKDDIALVGGKGANLGEMIRSGFPVPDGFIVTSKAYYQFVRDNNLTTKIKHLIQTAHFERHDSLLQVSKHIKNEILKSPISDELVRQIFIEYKKLGGVLSDALVAVRSSATAEDLPTASFAGQQDTFLNVKGEANLIEKIKEAWASLFNPRAIFYRHEQKFDHFKVGIAIPVQKMVSSDKSGIMFTIDPITNDKTKLTIEAIFGLGELIVQGQVTPDHYEVSKKDMSIASKQINAQTVLLKKSGDKNKEIKISSRVGKQQKLTDKEIIELAHLGKKLEKHYFFPQDIEWAIEKGKVYIVQTRPVTTIKVQKQAVSEESMSGKKVLVTGDPASPGMASGPVKVLTHAREIGKVVTGDVLVTPHTNPDFVPAMKKAVAIVTETGGRTSHAAIVSRELGIPAIVGATNAIKILKSGMVVTVNGSKGEVYQGGHTKISNFQLPISNERIKTATKVYVNLAQPELASRIARRQTDGVGLLRAEFMMAAIGTHPKKLIKDGKKQLFVNKLAEGLEQFCAAFNPRPVVYRASDLKTNEYRELIGGKEFEPHEPNPMLGFRGAFRYIHDPQVFELELEAIKIVRNKKGLKNLWIMLPFVRNVKELQDVKKLIASVGLHRSPSFKLWIMVELPANVVILDKFIEAGVDGVSIGSNDLTMLMLGTDRDNSEVSQQFDEQNEAVLWAFEHVIKTANKYKITSSMCGQAPSLYPSLLEKLVTWGITSVSVSPDAIENTRKTISQIEKKLVS